MIAALLSALLASPAGAQSHPDDVYWDPVFQGNGPNNRVRAIAIDGNDVYVGGRFTYIGDQNIVGIARWDGTDWHPLGGGVSEVTRILVHDGTVYVASGGLFRAWDGISWRILGRATGIYFIPAIKSIIEFKGDIHVSGGFTHIGAVEVNSVARYDGTAWHDLDGGLQDATWEWGPSAVIAADSNFVYAAGMFTSAGGIPCSGFARWDGQNWFAIDGLANRGGIRDVAVVDGKLYVAGSFSDFASGHSVVSNVGMFDGTRWHTMGGGVNDMALSVHPVGDLVYVAGNFTRAGGREASRVACWDGHQWRPLGSGLDTRGWTFAVAANEAGEVFVGGDQNTAGGVTSHRISRWFNPVPYPTAPTPRDGAELQLKDVGLNWSVSGPTGSMVTFDVHFGNNPEPPLVAPGQQPTTYDPGTLDHLTTYYWRIVARDEQGNHATGPVWSFTTEDEVTSRLVVSSSTAYCGLVTGDTVEIDVSIEDGAVPVFSGGFDLVYDSSHLTFVRCDPGELTSDWDALVCADLGGSVRVGGYALESIPAGSYGVFARLRFVASCCGPDSSSASTLTLTTLTDDLQGLRPIAGDVTCDQFVANGDVNGDGVLTSGDAFCVFESYLTSPRVLPGACAATGWDVRSDVDCSGAITPADALCIYLSWVDGSCGFCGGFPSMKVSAPVSEPVVAVSSLESDGEDIVVRVAVQGVPELEAFGFDITHPSDISLIGVSPSTVTLGFDQFDGLAVTAKTTRVGGYHTSPVDASVPVDLVILRYRSLVESPNGDLRINLFVDDVSGAEEVVVPVGDGPSQEVPAYNVYALHQNHPNPFNPTTVIEYEIPDAAGLVAVQLDVYTVEGKHVTVLENTRRSAGVHRVTWDGRANGQQLASGVYFYVLNAGDLRLARKLVLLK